MDDIFNLETRRKIGAASRPARDGRKQVAGLDDFLFVEAEVMPRRGAESGEVGLCRPGQVAGKARLASAVQSMLVCTAPLLSARSCTSGAKGSKL